MNLLIEKWASPIAPLLLVTDEEGALRGLEFADLESRMERLLRRYYGNYVLKKGAAPAALTRALGAYFEGDLGALAKIRVATNGTPFQRDIWKALRNIPAGTTINYGQLAEKVGRAGACRAAGAANGSNPVSLVVPCHRVIGANGALTGYGGGLPRKRWLLDHESRFAAAAASAS